MGTINNYMFVDYESYCHMCIHYLEDDDYDSTCHQCLLAPARDGSHRPEKFELNPEYKPNLLERELAMFKNK